MDLKQSNEIVSKLESIFNYSFLNPAEFVDLLIELDYDIGKKTVEHIRNNGILENSIKSTRLPNVVQFYDLYRMLDKKAEIKRTVNTVHCTICNDKGCITHRRTDNESEYPYEYALYCPDCEAGRDWKYDGRELTKKSEYYCEPITKYYDREKLRERNAKKETGGVVPMPEYIKQICVKHRINLRAIMQAKPKEACPF